MSLFLGREGVEVILQSRANTDGADKAQPETQKYLPCNSFGGLLVCLGDGPGGRTETHLALAVLGRLRAVLGRL